MAKISTNEFIRTEIQSALSQIKPTNEKISFIDFINLTFENVRIDDDQIFSLLNNEKSRKELSHLLKKTGLGAEAKILFLEALEPKSFFISSFKESVKVVLYSVIVQEFVGERYPSLKIKLVFENNQENLDRIIKYFSKSNFKI